MFAQRSSGGHHVRKTGPIGQSAHIGKTSCRILPGGSFGLNIAGLHPSTAEGSPGQRAEDSRLFDWRSVGKRT